MKTSRALNASSAAAPPEWPGEPIPLVVFPRAGGAGAAQRDAALRACAGRYLPRLGSMLFRGFEVHGEAAFERFVRAFDGPAPQLQAASIASADASGRLWIGCTDLAPAGEPTRLADRRELELYLPEPLRTRYADRAPLDAAARAELAAAFDLAAFRVDWERGDVLLIDRAITCWSVPAAAAQTLSFAAEPAVRRRISS